MKSIVLVDDNEDILELAKVILSEIENSEVHYFSQPHEALTFINSTPLTINCIITDILMPGMSGIDLVDQCETLHDVPILFLTALDDDKTIKKAYTLHSKVLTINYLTKPFNFTMFLSAVKTLLQTQEYFFDLIQKNLKIETLLSTIDTKDQQLVAALREILNT